MERDHTSYCPSLEISSIADSSRTELSLPLIGNLSSNRRWSPFRSERVALFADSVQELQIHLAENGLERNFRHTVQGDR